MNKKEKTVLKNLSKPVDKSLIEAVYAEINRYPDHDEEFYQLTKHPKATPKKVREAIMKLCNKGVVESRPKLHFTPTPWYKLLKEPEKEEVKKE